MKKNLLSVLVLLVAAVSTEAKSWKIGPASVNGMDFASINAAMNSSQVVAGDTLYLDQYYNENQEQNVTKRVVIIGTGYDTSLTDEQVVAILTNKLNLKASGAVVKSVKLSNLYFYNDDCIVERCSIIDIGTSSTTAGMNHIYSSYITGGIRGYSNSHYSQYDIQNCVMDYNWYSEVIAYLTSSKIINNTIIHQYGGNTYYALKYVNNTVIANNIILRTNANNNSDFDESSVTNSGLGNSIEHNIISHTNPLSYYPNNKIGYGGSISELFTQQGNYSDYYKLAEKSAALGYATDGGDCGCHGGMFGNPAGGRPQYIPYFSKVVVGSRTENGKLPVSVTVKIQDE